MGVLPGGVNSPVRAFGSVGGTVRFVVQASGARIEDADGNCYIDYVASWGAIILGHAHPVVIEAVRSAAGRGTSFGAPTEAEVELAERVIEHVPSVEMIRFVSSGTEATMSALRLARAATGRDRVLKFEGGYHGHADSLLAAAGSGVATLGIPGTAGGPQGAVADTVVIPYNDLEVVEAVFARYGEEMAAVIVEPIAANMGLVLPKAGFLAGLRDITRRYGSLLIFDEVITGFRVALGGAQARFGVLPDLSCFGKVIGGGLPVGAYGGRRSLMQQVAPEGKVFQAGTLSGNPLAMTAGIVTLRELERPGRWDGVARAAADLAGRLRRAAAEAGRAVQVNQIGTMLCLFFSDRPVTDWSTATACDGAAFSRFFGDLLDAGIYWVPSQFETVFLSAAHGDAELDITEAAARAAFSQLG